MQSVSVEHIELDAKGIARVSGTRSRIINIVLDARNGLTPDQIHEQYPHLSLSQIHAALAYYYDHQTELDTAIERELRDVDSAKAEADSSPTRTTLTARVTTNNPGGDT